MMGMLSQQYYFSGILAAVALAGAPGLLQLRMRRDRQMLLLVTILLVFAVKWRLAPLREIGYSTLPLFSLSPLMEYSLAHVMAQALLTYLTALLFLHREEGMPLYVPLLSANAMVLAGNIPAIGTGTTKSVYLWLSLAVAGLTALYFMTFQVRFANRPSRRPFMASILAFALLALALAGGAVSSRLLYKHRNDVDVFLGRLTYRLRQSSSVGFSRSARLGSVAAAQAEGGTAVALRIFSEPPPGYLRGMAFDTFLGDRWDVRGDTSEAAPDRPAVTAPPPESGETALRLREAPEHTGEWRVLSVFPTGRTDHAAFAPLGAVYLYAREGAVTVDREGAPISSTMQGTASYRVAVPKEASFAEIHEARRSELTALPEIVVPGVRELAASITRECRTDGETIEAIAEFFTSNFTYDFGIEIPEGEDPVTHFLLNRVPAHCEYFASGAAVLLRLADVPARYVTGYLVGAKNTYGGYWIARDKDAHAWVEAYDAERGWVLVEATPPGGRPSPEAGRLRQLWDYLKFRLHALWEALVWGDFAGFAGVLKAFFHDLFRAAATSVWFWLLLGALAARWVWGRRKRRAPRRGAVTSPEVRECQLLLARMNRHVSSRGHVRAPCETLGRFAARLEAAELDLCAGWYRHYTDVRYRSEIPPDAIEHLARELEAATTPRER